MRLLPLIGIILCTFAFNATGATKQAWTVSTAPLLKEPRHGSNTLSTLKKGQPVTVILRKRAWYQVKTSAGKGWVKMLSLRFAKSTNNNMGISSAWKSVTSSGTKTTVATGIRGFDEEDLRRATPNLQAVKKLSRYKVSSQQARSFANLGKIKTNNVSIH